LLCESEIEELYLTRGCHQDVRRFQIAMNALSVALQMASALEAEHAKGITVRQKT